MTQPPTETAQKPQPGGETNSGRTVQILVMIVLLGANLILFRRLLTCPGFYFQDFRCFYQAAYNYAAGLNPYTAPNQYYNYAFPATTLVFFRLFTFTSMRTAELSWFVLKLGMLVGLVLVWMRKFSISFDVKTALILSLGFSGAVMMDIATANISILEQLVVWWSLAMLIRRNYWGFVIGIVLISQFKGMYIVFLSLLLFIEEAPKWRVLLGAAALTACTIASNWLIVPTWRHDMAVNVRLIENGGAVYNPCSRAFISDLVGLLAGHAAGGTASLIGTLLYLLFIAVIGAISVTHVIRFKRSTQSPDPVLLIMFTCIVYALLMPRLKVYSYPVVIPPALYIISLQKRWTGLALLLLCLVPASNLYYPSEKLVIRVASVYTHLHIPAILSAYVNLFALFVLWVFFIRRLASFHTLSQTSPLVDQDQHAATPNPQR